MSEEKEKKYILGMVGKYSNIIIDHARNPRNVGNILKCDGFGQGVGECGDTMGIWLSVQNNRIAKATFWTDGCGTTIACGSMVTELVKERTIEEAFEINSENILLALGGLPEEHVHCAILASDTLKKALSNYKELCSFPWKKYYQKNQPV